MSDQLSLHKAFEDIKEHDIAKDLLEETKAELIAQKEEIETDTTINMFEKGMKKLRIEVKGTVLFGKNRNTKEKTEENEEKEETEREPYAPGSKLIMIDKVQENQAEFGAKVVTVADNLGVNPNRLMRVMNKESGLNHLAVNKKSKATGLIQFMPETAKGLGTTVDKLKNMSNVEQLDYVESYYRPYKDQIHSSEDLYLATLYPAAIGKSDDFVLGSEVNKTKAKKIGEQNNMNNGKPITVAHVKKRISKDIPSEYIAQFSDTKAEELYA